MTGDAVHELLDHTGDIGFRVRAGSREALFAGAVRALFDVIVDVETVEARQAVPVSVTGGLDDADGLVRFLSEILFLHDARGWLFRGARSVSLGPSTIEAVAEGEPFDPARHAILRQVKAVTYHRAQVRREGETWVAEIVLDL